MRALELYLLTGKPASMLKSGTFFKLPDETHAHFVYLDWDKDALAKRIEKRTAQLFEGMCKETRALLSAGFAPDTPALKSLGYPQAVEFLQGKLSRQAALERVIILTRQYAKRQRTWFNRYTNATRLSLTTASDFQPEKLAAQILQVHKKSA